ncbi:MAG: AAA family ATPase [Candidatus Omnitrophica bacterium]|jgi:uncharacterized protein (UPF0335 family)|nr:AAA family ATPase [Candidatus Omnitrophota bacterium]
MFKSIRLQNFQSHMDTTISFAKHVTAIVGLNNNGKSAIFRACRKVLRDYPEGVLFIREKQKFSSIELTTDSGVIERIVRNDKSAENNVYKVDGLQFTKFGKTGIPIEVLEKMEASPLQQFGDVEFDINFQQQLDPLFLISGDGLASVRGKVLGRVSGVDYAERAVQMASAEIKSLSRDIEQNIKDTKQNEEKLSQYETVPELIETLCLIDSLQEKQDDVDREIEHLSVIHKDLANIVSEVVKINSITKALDVDVYSIYQEINQLGNIVKTLEYCIDINKQLQISEQIAIFSIPKLNDIEAYKKSILLLEAAIETRDNLERLDHVNEIILPNIKVLEDASNKLESLKKLKLGIELSLSTYNTTVGIVKSIEEQLAKEEQQFEQLKQELGVCPMCDRPFDHEH